jgi:hypothetical protein
MCKIEKNRSERRVHGGRPRPTGAVVPRGKKKTSLIKMFVKVYLFCKTYLRKCHSAIKTLFGGHFKHI